MEKAFDHIQSFLRDQPVLCIAALVALASMAFVLPGPGYADYIDWRVLGLLFSLMLCVAGLQEAGIFAWTAKRLLGGSLSARSATLILTLLCFFTSMLVTNDVALITFVPFTLFLFTIARQEACIAWAVVLQTLAANLGSMVTPMGNPQNLFLFAHYNLELVEFALAILPFAAFSLVLLIVAAVAFSKNQELSSAHGGASSKSSEGGQGDQSDQSVDLPAACLFACLFVFSVLSVLKIVPLIATLAITILLTLVFRRKILLKVDYALLATFVCFFVFSGNLANIPVVRDALVSLMAQSPFAVSLIASQVISNVPSAVVLAPFTEAWQQLMLGVDIGGLGTPIASLASLISLEFYRRSRAGSVMRYLRMFLAANAVFLVANIAFGLIIGSF